MELLPKCGTEINVIPRSQEINTRIPKQHGFVDCNENFFMIFNELSVAQFRWQTEAVSQQKLWTGFGFFVTLTVKEVLLRLMRELHVCVCVSAGNRDQSSTHKHMCYFRCYIWVWGRYLCHLVWWWQGEGAVRIPGGSRLRTLSS